MKKSLFFAIALPLSMILASCDGPKTTDETETGTDAALPETGAPETTEAQEAAFPWDFPENIKNEGLAEGQTILSIHSFYPDALKESDDPANETYIFYNGKLTSVGDTKSTVYSFSEEVEMPNSLLIPIPEGQTAKKGDIVLTWWQSGSGMERALVTDAKDPASPKVDYLDLNYKDDGTGFAQDHADEQIKPNSFVVLKDGEWQPGAQIVVTGDGSYEAGILISCTKDKVLAKCFAGKINTFKKSDCKIVPLNQSLKVGDQVRAIFTSSYKDGYTITKIDENVGRVWVEGSFGNEILSILEVYKE